MASQQEHGLSLEGQAKRQIFKEASASLRDSFSGDTSLLNIPDKPSRRGFLKLTAGSLVATGVAAKIGLLNLTPAYAEPSHAAKPDNQQTETTSPILEVKDGTPIEESVLHMGGINPGHPLIAEVNGQQAAIWQNEELISPQVVRTTVSVKKIGNGEPLVLASESLINEPKAASGRYVIVRQGTGPELAGKTNLQVYDWVEEKMHTIPTEDQDAQIIDPSTDGKTIVWRSYKNKDGIGKIQGFSVEKNEFTVSNANGFAPVVFENIAAWEQIMPNGRKGIAGIDMKTGMSGVLATPGVDYMSPSVYGDKIVCKKSENKDTKSTVDLLLIDLSTGTVRPIPIPKEVTIDGSTFKVYVDSAKIVGDWVVYNVNTRSRDLKSYVYAYHLKTGQRIRCKSDNAYFPDLIQDTDDPNSATIVYGIGNSRSGEGIGIGQARITAFPGRILKKAS